MNRLELTKTYGDVSFELDSINLTHAARQRLINSLHRHGLLVRAPAPALGSP